jgi:four helix bundle protein
MLNLSHKKLDVWKDSIKLVAKIYELTEDFPSEEKFGLVSQMRRASVSITSNLSEGAARSSRKERKRFYEIARSSLVEVDTQLEISSAVNVVSEEDLKSLDELMNKVFAKITSMKRNA